MTQRSRSRNAGAIDSNLSPSNAIPPLPAWVSGRFYGSPFFVGAAPTTTAALSAASILSPFLIPNDVTLTSIGIEVTVGGTAGAYIRLGIYDNGSRFMPNNLLLDASTVASDATGFLSISISKYLRAGFYWTCICSYTPTTHPTVRMHSNTYWHLIHSSSDISTPGQVYFPDISIATIGPYWATSGLARQVPITSSGNGIAITTSTGNIPRVLLGV